MPASLSFRPSEASGEICYQQSRSLDFARDDIAGAISKITPQCARYRKQDPRVIELAFSLSKNTGTVAPTASMKSTLKETEPL